MERTKFPKKKTAPEPKKDPGQGGEVMNDESLMRFGAHKGKRLIDVPADYLIFMYENKRTIGALTDYIKDNLDVLKLEREKQKRYER